jgi:murein L,D-transpeptidase YcbB/YkuD
MPSPLRSLRPRTALAAFTLLSLLAAAGCRHPRKSTSAPNTADYADNIQALVAKPQLAMLRWPNYSDYQPAVATFYDDRNDELAWLRDLKPTAQTTAFLQAFADAGAKGLNPEDYDASRWPARLKTIGQNRSARRTPPMRRRTQSRSSMSR